MQQCKDITRGWLDQLPVVSGDDMAGKCQSVNLTAAIVTICMRTVV